MDREDAEEGSAPKRHKRSHHHHEGGSDPGDAAGAEGRVGAASLAPGEAGEGAIALDEGAAAADAGRALTPAPVCSDPPPCSLLPLGNAYRLFSLPSSFASEVVALLCILVFWFCLCSYFELLGCEIVSNSNIGYQIVTCTSSILSNGLTMR